MTKESAKGPCPECGGKRHKVHTLEHDIAVCNKCGHTENITYEVQKTAHQRFFRGEELCG